MIYGYIRTGTLCLPYDVQERILKKSNVEMIVSDENMQAKNLNILLSKLQKGDTLSMIAPYNLADFYSREMSADFEIKRTELIQKGVILNLFSGKYGNITRSEETLICNLNVVNKQYEVDMFLKYQE